MLGEDEERLQRGRAADPRDQPGRHRDRHRHQRAPGLRRAGVPAPAPRSPAFRWSPRPTWSRRPRTPAPSCSSPACSSASRSSCPRSATTCACSLRPARRLRRDQPAAACRPARRIMPGKVNPVIPEVVNQIAFEVIGNDVTVTMAAEAGQLQLNAFEPIIAHSLFKSIDAPAQRLPDAGRALRRRHHRQPRAAAPRRRALDRHRHRAQPVHRLRQRHRDRAARRCAPAQRLRAGAGKGLLTQEQLDEILRPEVLTPAAAFAVTTDRRRAAGGEHGAEGNRVRIDERGGIAPSLRGAKWTKQFILSLRGEMDCFALLAMTADLLAICPRMPG